MQDLKIVNLEDVFKTEGFPELTLVKAPNFNDLKIDLRALGKPVIIEGQTGTGKTTTVRAILSDIKDSRKYKYLSARDKDDVEEIKNISLGKVVGQFVIDDFHRLPDAIKVGIADIMKQSAEKACWDFRENPENKTKKFEDETKIVVIGINDVGSGLINLVPDIAKRCGIHKIEPADFERTMELIKKGTDSLNIEIEGSDTIFSETRGDYWLTQMMCKNICLINDVLETKENDGERRLAIKFDLIKLRRKMVEQLSHGYKDTVTKFCRGNRFRKTNDPYYKLLKAISAQSLSVVDLTELANFNSDAKGSINNIKENRLSNLLENKTDFDKYFYYNQNTKRFAIEDPALFYYIKHLDWDALRDTCGFNLVKDEGYEFDFAISYATENSLLANELCEKLIRADYTVFFDKLYEGNYLGRTWSESFSSIFGEKSKFIICILDIHYSKKIWPIFEMESFLPRVKDSAVIPIYLDGTIIAGMPRDTIGVKLDGIEITQENVSNIVDTKIIEYLNAKYDQ